MTRSNIPVVDLQDLRAGGERARRFVDTVGGALHDIGFFSVRGHDVSQAMIDDAYEKARRFFALPPDVKARYEDARAKAQRGFTSFGKEHAKGASAPDLKEFFQIGRTDVPDDH